MKDKIYCVNCKHFMQPCMPRFIDGGFPVPPMVIQIPYGIPYCTHTNATYTVDTAIKEETHQQTCESRNVNNDCSDFENKELEAKILKSKWYSKFIKILNQPINL